MITIKFLSCVNELEKMARHPRGKDGPSTMRGGVVGRGRAQAACSSRK